MSLISDFLALLDRVPVVKRLQAVSGEVAELKNRVKLLEEKLGDRWQPDVCKFCGKQAARLESSYGPNDKGNMREEWKCAECGQYEVRMIKPK